MPTSAEPSASSVKKGTTALIMRTRSTAGMAVAIGIAGLGIGGLAAAQTPAAPDTAPPAAAPAPPPPLAAGVVATVNDDVISTYDLTQRIRLLIVVAGIQPTQDNMPQIEREALRGLIDEHLEMGEIRREEKEQKFKITASDDDVSDELARMAQGNQMSKDQFIGALASQGVGAETLRDQIRANMSWQRWIQGRYGGSRLKVGQTQVNAAFAQIQSDAAKPQYQISEIFIDAARVGGMDTAMNGAQQLITQLQQGAPFAAVARQFSGGATAANGGDAGWLSEAQLPAEVRDGISELRPGQLSKPIPVKDGVYIILLKDKRSGAGADLVTLKQAAIALPAGASADQVEAARQRLLALKGRITSCDNMEAAAAKVDGVVAGDLGEADIKDLRPDFQSAAIALNINQVSDPIRTDVGLHLIAVCGKRQAGQQMPTREDVESRLQDQQLSMISKRYLRDLRNSATIDTR
jgi:peptidyl-prolyl cis-trans isomerase SurA